MIANHILVSFHVAFISSILALPAADLPKAEVLKFIFASPETVVSALFMYLSFHAGIAFHEIGHFQTAARLSALSDTTLKAVRDRLERGRLSYYLGLFLKIPYGKALGIKREGLNYYPDAPYNLAVAAAGPRASRNVALVAFPVASALIAFGLLRGEPISIYVGRPILGLAIVAVLDYLLADPGKYREFRERERRARDKAATVEKMTGWLDIAPTLKRRMLAQRMQSTTHPRLGPVTAPWQFRNCGMGGRHTEKEYPESNVSMQEAMFLPLRAPSYQEAQELTVRLQNRLKEIIEKEEGCRVMGIGLEGGLAPYIEKGPYPLPEVRLWLLMKQAIQEVGCRPGHDVAIALDPAMSELENAYRSQFNVPDAVGQYLFWRDKAQTVLDRDGVLDVYVKAMEDYEIPILSIEDGFSEDDYEGWRLLLEKLGDKVFVIGDDLVTTNDRTIEIASSQGLINTALIKANQIGTLTETILAMLVALGKGMDLVVSHRSKSPNDDMEGQIALAVNALGLKCGGGANTERLIKYQAVTELLQKAGEAGRSEPLLDRENATFSRIRAYEEPTNAGVPTVGVTAEVLLRDVGLRMMFRGATPLGTSAGTAEAIHLVDSVIERAEHTEILEKFPDYFREVEPGVRAFKKGVDEARVRGEKDEQLLALFARADRYQGKGCLNAVDNVIRIIAPYFESKNAAGTTLVDIDRSLLELELRTARRRNKLGDDAALPDIIQVCQRKQNLGMNAILSVSLALGRALAHVQGKELYELLREQMLAIIDTLATQCGVRLAGSTLFDAIEGLREANRVVEGEGRTLHEVLREITGIYGVEGHAEGRPPAEEEVRPGKEIERFRPPGTKAPLPEELPAVDDDLTAEQAGKMSDLDVSFYRAFVTHVDRVARRDALQKYLDTRSELASRIRQFGVVNNRIFRSSNALLVPYLMRDDVVLHVVRGGETTSVTTHRFAPGTIFTDRLLLTVAGLEGEPVDLEAEIYLFDAEQAQSPQIGRIQDLASLLEAVNECTNRNEAVFLLRCLVAHLCGLSAKSFLGAKNLQPEVHNLTGELYRFLNGHLSRRLPLLRRILVRNLPGIIGKPHVIDRLWNDTIDLAEVHVRGSSIVNELRRSSHHALGQRTLLIARTYLRFLRDGDASALLELGLSGAAQADLDARGQDAPREITERVVQDLERLLGTSEIVARIQEWRQAYGESLLRCEFGNSIQEELERLIEKGVRASNRWVYRQVLAILERKLKDFSDPRDIGESFRSELEALQALKPDEPDFDRDGTERRARQAVDAFVREIRAAHQDSLFGTLQSILEMYERRAFFVTVNSIRTFRMTVEERIRHCGFTEQRFYLLQLDCLLEEMGYLALRHIAQAYDERGVDLEECLAIIQTSILNLDFDGVGSRELNDLGAMLTDGRKTDHELLNVLDALERSYHKLRQRVIVPFEKARERLGLSEDDLRVVLANMQRYMHDLNSMVQFANIASTFIRDNLSRGVRSRRVAAVAAPPDDAWAIVHLSDHEEIGRIVERGVDGPSLRDLYGAKGCGLIYISYLDLPTRDGFILPATLPRSGKDRSDRSRLEVEVDKHLRILERDIERQSGLKKQFASEKRPLLLAVRGGSVFSMPGILSTVVFAGINDRIAETLAEEGAWSAYDSYRRFLASYGKEVWGLDLEGFDLVEQAKRRHGVRRKKDLSWEGMREVVEESKAILRKNGFGPQLDEILAEPRKQVLGAIDSLFKSWRKTTASRYRDIKGLCDSWDTVAIVQEMAFGNRLTEPVEVGMDEAQASLTGVIPRTFVTDAGVRAFSGEFKFSAAGDDLVSGVSSSRSFRPVEGELRELMPMLETRLKHAVAKLRRFMGTDQEIEFTVERGVLSILQTRTAETPTDRSMEAFLDPGEPVTRGLGVCGGAFRGVVAFDDEDRQRVAERARGDDVDGVLMVVENPSPEDIPVIISADGLLAAKGGSTSHAAVAINSIDSRPMSAVMSAVGLEVDSQRHEAVLHDSEGNPTQTVRVGDVLSIHGTSGEVYIGSRELHRPPTA